MAKLDAALQFGLQAAEAEVNAEIAASPGLEGSQSVAERARFLTGVDPKAHCFDPTSHLPYLEALCYIEPRLLEVSEHTPCEVPVARFAAPRAEANSPGNSMMQGAYSSHARTKLRKANETNLLQFMRAPRSIALYGAGSVDITSRHT